VTAFDAETAAASVVEAMLPLADATRAAQEKRYLKSDLDFLGVTVPGIRLAVTKTARSYPGLPRDGALAWARALWREPGEPVHERRMAAIEVLCRYAKILEPADLAQVEGWVREAGSWAYVDSLAGTVAGTIALRHPAAWPLIDPWATDPDFWLRRSALLTLLPGIRRGQPDRARFERYATPMLAEREFFIRKAIGWVLREISKQDPAYVAAWAWRHLDAMSGVTFREAVRRLPEADAAGLRSAYTPGRKIRRPYLPNGPGRELRLRRPATGPRPPPSGCTGDPGQRARSPRRCRASRRSPTARRGARTGPG
jgi:3-methyladenine DNA glycosylase AlkD